MGLNACHGNHKRSKGRLGTAGWSHTLQVGNLPVYATVMMAAFQTFLSTPYRCKESSANSKPFDPTPGSPHSGVCNHVRTPYKQVCQSESPPKWDPHSPHPPPPNKNHQKAGGRSETPGFAPQPPPPPKKKQQKKKKNRASGFSDTAALSPTASEGFRRLSPPTWSPGKAPRKAQGTST